MLSAEIVKMWSCTQHSQQFPHMTTGRRVWEIQGRGGHCLRGNDCAFVPWSSKPTTRETFDYCRDLDPPWHGRQMRIRDSTCDPQVLVEWAGSGDTWDTLRVMTITYQKRNNLIELFLVRKRARQQKNIAAGPPIFFYCFSP